MTTNDAFINELLRSANEVDRLTATERRRLLERAAGVVVGLRSQLTDARLDARDAIPNAVNRWVDAADVPDDPQIVREAIIEAVAIIRVAEGFLRVRAERAE